MSPVFVAVGVADPPPEYCLGRSRINGIFWMPATSHDSGIRLFLHDLNVSCGRPVIPIDVYAALISRLLSPHIELPASGGEPDGHPIPDPGET